MEGGRHRCLVSEYWCMCWPDIDRYCQISVHVPSDTFRTWKWSPSPKTLSSIEQSNIKKNSFARKLRNQDSTTVLP